MNRLPWIAAAAFVVAALAWIGKDRRLSHHAFEPFSSQNMAPQGLSLAYRYLGETGRSVAMVARPVDRAFLPADAVLFRVGPDSADRGNAFLFTAAEEEWIRGGGRMVLAAGRTYGSLKVEAGGKEPAVKSFPAWPDVKRLEAEPVRRLQGPPMDRANAIFVAGADPVVARLPMGRGEAILCTVPEIFQNGRLGRADHLALLERLAGAGRPVYFDESVHGGSGGAGLLEILGAWGFGPFIFLGGLAAAASFWRRRSRVGPEEDDARETRVEAVDFVDSLALLYRRSLRRRQAVLLYRKAFEQAAAVQTGLRGAPLEARVVELMGGRRERAPKGRDLGKAEFEKELAAINDAFGRLDDAKRSGSGRKNRAGARPA